MFCQGIEPTCKCGCGGEVKFLDITRGFADYIRGHHSRIKNNFQTEKSVKNSLATRKKMIETGEWKPFNSNETGEHWSKGLTKETDERIAKMANSIANNHEEIKRRSERMKKGRLDGTIPTLYGEDHSQWKGGISCLRSISHSKLYAVWKLPKIKAANYKCQICDKGGTMEVHHDKERFAEILNNLATIHGWETSTWKSDESWEVDEKYHAIKTQIADAVADYHIENNVSGIVLCEECHKKEHEKYNL